METELPKIILKTLQSNRDFSKTVLPHLKPEYFQQPYSSILTVFTEYVNKYNDLPNTSALGIEYGNSEHADEKTAPVAFEVISSLDSVPGDTDPEWVKAETEKFCQERAIHLAVMKSIDIIDGRDPALDKGMIPQVLSDAIGVTFDSHVGHDYIEDAEERHAFYHRTEEKIPFDIEAFNTATNGGITKKTLNVFMAPPHAGKSLALCHLAAGYLSNNLNVVYITMEMAEERIAERIDANLMDIAMDQIGNLSKDMFTDRIKKIQTRYKGNLVVKEYPTGCAHAGHFRALINDLKLKKQFIPDVIIIDYMNICASSRHRGLSGSVNSYSLVKSIGEELRGLAVETTIPIWTATQVNREGGASSDFTIENTSESYGVPAIADSMFGIIATDELKKAGQFMIKQLKNRYRDMNYMEKFMVGVDRAKMRLYDLDDSTPSTDSAVTETISSTPFSAPKKNFDDFKI